MKSNLTRMLDEIGRLRGVLEKEHTKTCAVLREDSPCDCGCVTGATAARLENRRLSVMLVQAQQMIVRQNVEIARLDALVRREVSVDLVPSPSLCSAA